MYDVMVNKYGNPSSLHGMGLEAELAMKIARSQIAAAMGTAPEAITFTSGATEANNLALFGAAAKGRREGARIVSTAFEHPSVLEPLRALEVKGYELVLLCPDQYGHIRPEAFAEQTDENTVLVSAMAVNNEFGSVLDVEAIAKAVKRKNPHTLVHSDASQAFGKLPIRFGVTYLDLVTVSGHKLHAPKGVGALYMNRQLNIAPQLLGGGQEGGLRSGTEATSLIAGFGEAAEQASKNLAAADKHVRTLNSYLRGELMSLPRVVINSPDEAVPYILNLSVPGIPSEVMMRFLEERGVYVSSGSACGKGKRSYALRSAELPAELVASALRVGISRFTTAEEIAAFVGALSQGIQSLKKR